MTKTTPAGVAAVPGPPLWRGALVLAAAIYCASVLLGCLGSRVPRDILPAPVLFFTQVAGLFPHGKEFDIDYRVEGLRCADGRWAEVDVRPDFPIRPDDKESSFQRLGYFFRREPVVMRAFDDFVTRRHNGRAPADQRIGGVRLLSLRIPVPPPGGEVQRYRRLDLAEYPTSFHKAWYETPPERAADRCRG